MKQLTAVEWLVQKLNSKYGNDDFIITHINEIEQAKQMEKEQMDDAYCQGCKDIIENIKSGRYYSKIYKK